jgi:hypothetical protein
MARSRRRVTGQDILRGASDLYGSGHRVWADAQRQGMPDWAWVGVTLCAILGPASGIAVWFASTSVLAAGVIGGVFWLAGAAIVEFGVLSQRAELSDECAKSSCAAHRGR